MKEAKQQVTFMPTGDKANNKVSFYGNLNNIIALVESYNSNNMAILCLEMWCNRWYIPPMFPLVTPPGYKLVKHKITLYHVAHHNHNHHPKLDPKFDIISKLLRFAFSLSSGSEGEKSDPVISVSVTLQLLHRAVVLMTISRCALLMQSQMALLQTDTCTLCTLRTSYVTNDR